MIITTKTKLKEVIPLMNIFDIPKLMEERETELPDSICGVKVCQDLSLITFGDRIDLCEMKTYKDFFFLPLKVLYGLNEDEILNEPFWKIYSFSKMCLREISEMNERDEKTFNYKPTEEELQAGYATMNYGHFGTIDTIALRLGVSHDYVLELPQIRIYQMLKIDFEKAMFNRKLQDIYMKKNLKK